MGKSGNNENENNSLLAFVTGALLGGAIGTALGIFLAPKSGTEMRYHFSEGVHDAQEKTKQLLGETRNSIGQSVDKATKNLESTVHRVTEAFNAGRKAAKDSVSEPSGASETESLQKNPDKINKSDNISDKVNQTDILSDRINKSENQDDKSGKIKNEKTQEAAKIGEEVTKKNKAEG
jgi:gas vesicle protein